MLIYENEGFLEVESKQIQQLCRSTAAVSLDETGRESSAFHAVLCDYPDNSESRCRVAFYSKILKRAFIFVVKNSARQSAWQCGQDALVQLGFQLEEVKLKLSPAMLEVVMRDVPGLLSPAEARKQRTEKSSLLAGFQRAYDEAPDSAQGKKAVLKLNAEKRLNAQSEELRHLLEELFSSKENATAEFEALVSQVKDLTSRLESAKALAEAERNQREMSESITSAAEKRIQELEEVLVDVETKSSKTLKQKQKNIQLQTRIKELDRELAYAEIEVGKEREKQTQFIDDVNTALERVSRLEKELKEAETSLENIQAQLTEERAEKAQLAKNFQEVETSLENIQVQLTEEQAEKVQLTKNFQEAETSLENIQAQLTEEQAEKAQLTKSFQEAELRIKTLDSGLKNAEKKVVQRDESAKVSENIQAQLDEVQQALKDSLDLNGALEKKLASANEQNEKLTENLQTAKKAACDKTGNEAQVTALAEQNGHLVSKLEALRDELDQEHSIRKRLEKGAVEEDKRIQELEASLAKVTKDTSETPSVDKDSEGGDRELTSLQVELQELSQRFKSEQKSRKGLESEVDEAHKLIDSLEKMIRETERAATGQRFHDVSNETENQKLQELEKKLRAVENQLEHERVEQKKLVKAVVVAENKLAEQEELLAQGQVEQLERAVRETTVAEMVTRDLEKPVKLMPHDLRPAPKKDALFRPDWDLEGLPCQSSKQIFMAWETVFNVQTSLEGYPSQYCMAFLIVLRLKKQKKLYMLYRLKMNKHTLVCVPAKTPKDEASLEKSIKEGLNFLKMSGFEMDEMTEENIDSTLKTYFLEG